MGHVQKEREVLCRVEGPRQSEAPQGLQDRQRSTVARKTGARQTGRGKSTRRAGVGSLATAWAEANPIDRHRRAVAQTILETFNETPLDQLNPELFATSLLARWKKRYTAITVVNYASRLRGFCRWADKLDGTYRLTGCVPQLAQPDDRTVCLTEEEARTAIAKAAPWFRVVLLSCYELGLRSGTAIELGPEHWSEEQHTITIETKGHRKITLPVSPELEELFRTSGADRGTPFWLAHRGDAQLKTTRTRRCNYHLVQNHWITFKKKHGLQQNLWMHDLRRSLAVHVHRSSGGDLFAAQAALGHRNLATTLRYLAPLTKDTAKLRSTLSLLWRPKGGIN